MMVTGADSKDAHARPLGKRESVSGALSAPSLGPWFVPGLSTLMAGESASAIRDFLSGLNTGK